MDEGQGAAAEQRSESAAGVDQHGPADVNCLDVREVRNRGQQGPRHLSGAGAQIQQRRCRSPGQGAGQQVHGGVRNPGPVPGVMLGSGREQRFLLRPDTGR
ncbi:hypothetical protein ACIOML_23600 [Streptomyces anulatus]